MKAQVLLSSVISLLLSMVFGFTAVAYFGALLYVGAYLALLGKIQVVPTPA